MLAIWYNCVRGTAMPWDQAPIYWPSESWSNAHHPLRFLAASGLTRGARHSSLGTSFGTPVVPQDVPGAPTVEAWTLSRPLVFSSPLRNVTTVRTSRTNDIFISFGITDVCCTDLRLRRTVAQKSKSRIGVDRHGCARRRFVPPTRAARIY